MDQKIPTLLKVSLENLRNMIDVDTIIGKSIIHEDITIIPVSKVKMGFLSGGSDFSSNNENPPFGGGAGGTMSLTPVAFLVCTKGDVRMIKVDDESNVLDKLIERIPSLLEHVKDLFKDDAEIVKA